jgi:hypothetical protein
MAHRLLIQIASLIIAFFRTAYKGKIKRVILGAAKNLSLETWGKRDSSLRPE